MKHLPFALIVTGLFVLLFSLWKIIQQMSQGLPEQAHYVQRHPLVYIHDAGQQNGRASVRIVNRR